MMLDFAVARNGVEMYQKSYCSFDDTIKHLLPFVTRSKGRVADGPYGGNVLTPFRTVDLLGANNVPNDIFCMLRDHLLCFWAIPMCSFISPTGRLKGY